MDDPVLSRNCNLKNCRKYILPLQIGACFPILRKQKIAFSKMLLDKFIVPNELKIILKADDKIRTRQQEIIANQ